MGPHCILRLYSWASAAWSCRRPSNSAIHRHYFLSSTSPTFRNSPQPGWISQCNIFQVDISHCTPFTATTAFIQLCTQFSRPAVIDSLFAERLTRSVYGYFSHVLTEPRAINRQWISSQKYRLEWFHPRKEGNSTTCGSTNKYCHCHQLSQKVEVCILWVQFIKGGKSVFLRYPRYS